MDVVGETHKAEKTTDFTVDKYQENNFLASQSDKTIWISFKKGDHAAFNYIYKTYFSVLFNYGRQFTADRELIKDCIQD